METHIIHLLRRHTKQFDKPLMNFIIDTYGKKPFLLLIGCLLSLRSKDVVTIQVCKDLFAVAQIPQEILNLSRGKLEQILFKLGFFRNKANALHEVSRTIIEQYDGKVPNSVDELLKIKGVGRKTANLVVGLAFDIPAICVDVHVHRISNRLGIINTNTPYETEMALQKILPRTHWIEWNKLLVMWGQNVCTPRSPKCSRCVLKRHCKFT